MKIEPRTAGLSDQAIALAGDGNQLGQVVNLTGTAEAIARIAL
jgi:hypothetical protein